MFDAYFERINRNILECKEFSDIYYLSSDSRINRNILECKERSSIRFALLYNVLIETYWNVKVVAHGKTLTLRLY